MKYHIICNWKTYLPFDEVVTFSLHKSDLELLTKEKSVTLVLCPSQESLSFVKSAFVDSDILVGAQNCSEFAPGAHTGQVSALSLAQMKVDMCIIGHSEQRVECGEITVQIQAKLQQLYAQTVYTISPIICIGENLQEYQNNQTKKIIEIQLVPLLEFVMQ